MLYQFLRPISIQIKPVRDAQGKLKLVKKSIQFTKGIHEVQEEVENHKFFALLIEKSVVIPIADLSAKSKEALEKAEDKASKAAAKAAAKAAEALEAKQEAL